MNPAPDDVSSVAVGLLRKLADPEAAVVMAAYMKSSMPFYGVKKPARARIAKELKRRFPPETDDEYRDRVSDLWSGSHREMKYLAIDYAVAFPMFIGIDQIGLYERMIREGAWWDLVDGVASWLVGEVVLNNKSEMRAVLESWIEDPDLWIRRTAIICQLNHRQSTDGAMLFDFCGRRAHETEFFIRKAIGWALRQYARTDPEAVRGYVEANRHRLSGLSIREATRHL